MRSTGRNRREETVISRYSTPVGRDNAPFCCLPAATKQYKEEEKENETCQDTHVCFLQSLSIEVSFYYTSFFTSGLQRHTFISHRFILTIPFFMSQFIPNVTSSVFISGFIIVFFKKCFRITVKNTQYNLCSFTKRSVFQCV